MIITRLGLGQRGFYFGLGLAVGLGFAAHGAAASIVSTACRSGSPAQQPAVVAHPAHQAQLLVSDQHRWWLSLERVAVVGRLHSSFADAHAHGKYVVIFMAAQNVGKAPQTLSDDEHFALRDAQGRQFDPAGSDPTIAAFEQYKRDSYFDPVQPTFSAHVAVVFDIAADARGLTLVNVPSEGDRTQKIFSLGL